MDSGTLVNALAERRDDLTGVVAQPERDVRRARQPAGGAGGVGGAAPAVHAPREHDVREPARRARRRRPARGRREAGRARLGPFLDAGARLRADGEPTIRDLSRTIRAPGPNNDLIELIKSFPPLAQTALDDAARSTAPTGRGAFPETTDALKAAAPTIAFGRPYTPDFVGWMDDFSTTGGYDALGGFSRAWINLSEILYGPGPKTKQYQPLPGRERGARRATAATSSRASAASALELRPEPEVGGPVIRRVVAALAVVLARGRGGAGARREVETRAAARPTSCCSTTPSASPRAATSGSPACAPARPPTFKVVKVNGRAARGVVTAEVTEPGFARPAQGRALRDPAAVADRRVLRGLPAGHVATSGIPDGGRLPVEQTSSTIADRPRQRHHAAPLPRAPPADRRRARRGPRGPPGRPLRRCSGARIPALRETSETLRILGKPDEDDQEVHRRLATRSSARSRTASRTWCASCSEAGDTAEISAIAARRAAAQSFQRLPAFLDELEPYMDRLGELADGADAACCATSSAPSGELDTFFTRLGPFAEAGRPAVQGARRDARGRARSAFTEDDAGGRTSCASSPRTRPASPSRSASSSRRSTTASARSSRTTARAATGPPARRQDAHISEPGRLHRHGGDLELLLLADALHQHAGRHRRTCCGSSMRS